MSGDVKRYAIISDDWDYVESPSGGFVDHDDYAALEDERDALRAEAEALRAQRDNMAQILRDLVPGCKWRFMRPRIDQALQEVDGGN